MNIEELNKLDEVGLKVILSNCCGASAWVNKMSKAFPIKDEETLLKKAEEIWYCCDEKDWREAFTHHPKIGDLKTLQEKFAATRKWAEGEQSAVKDSSLEVVEALATGNKLYEEKFGYIFIVCATGKLADEMLQLLQSRLTNRPEDEIKIAMEEQNKITKLRLQKLLTS